MFIQPAISRSYVPQSSAARFAAKARAALSSFIDDSSNVSRHARQRDQYLPWAMPGPQQAEEAASPEDAASTQQFSSYTLTQRSGRPGIVRAVPAPCAQLNALA